MTFQNGLANSKRKDKMKDGWLLTENYQKEIWRKKFETLKILNSK